MVPRRNRRVPKRFRSSCNRAEQSTGRVWPSHEKDAPLALSGLRPFQGIMPSLGTELPSFSHQHQGFTTSAQQAIDNAFLCTNALPRLYQNESWCALLQYAGTSLFVPNSHAARHRNSPYFLEQQSKVDQTGSIPTCNNFVGNESVQIISKPVQTSVHPRKC